MRNWSAHFAGRGLLLIPGYEGAPPPPSWSFAYFPATPSLGPLGDADAMETSMVRELVYRRTSYSGCSVSYVPDDRIEGNVERCIAAAEAMEQNLGAQHVPEIHPGVYRVGRSQPLRMQYNQGPSSWVREHGVVTVTGSCGTVEPTVEGSEYARVGNQLHEEVRGVGRQTGPRSWDASAEPEQNLQWDDELDIEREPWELTGYVPDWAETE